MADPIGRFFDDLFDRLHSRCSGPPGGAGTAIDDHDVEEALRHLTSLTIYEFKRRGLWTAPPSYVGHEGARWLQPGVLDDFVGQVFMFVLVERFQSLVNVRKLGKKTGWRVRNYVGFFITERQKEADPIGYRVFGRLKASVTTALEQGFLFLFGEALEAGEEPELDNQSRLTYVRGRFVAAAVERLRDAARFLNDRVLPRLVTDDGRAVPKLLQRLTEALEALGRELEDFEAFRLGELSKELKDDARRRLEALGLQEVDTAVDGGAKDPDDGSDLQPTLVIPVEAHDETLTQWSDRRRFVLRLVSDRIDAMPAGQDRDESWKLWTFLKSTRLLSDVERAALAAEGLKNPDDPGLGQKLNQAELERELGLSRRRLPKLLARLEELVGDALLESAGRAGTTRVNGTAFHGGPIHGGPVHGGPISPTAPTSPIDLSTSPASDDAGQPRS